MSTVAVVGLGYVGLPLAVEFGKRFSTIGFDLNAEKVAHYRDHVDPTGEVSTEDLRAAARLTPTTDPVALKQADFVVVAVPTPIDNARLPDFAPLVGASEIVGKNLKRGAIVVYESTVYPGATEEGAFPCWRNTPARNGSRTFSSATRRSVSIPATRNTPSPASSKSSPVIPRRLWMRSPNCMAPSSPRACIARRASAVAEAAKVIENTQRDLNIALMNELALIFNKLGIDTLEVLQAAGTKWNFLPFRPGLVGGHCIGVDPYYLTHKAEMIGYHPEVILAGRRINDNMGKYIAEQTIKQMIASGSPIKGAKVNMLGLTFKENVPDLRNSKVIDVIRELRTYGVDVFVHDPVAAPEDARHEYGIELSSWEELPVADAIVVAVAHKQFLQRAVSDYQGKLSRTGCFVDVKSQFDLAPLRGAGVGAWRL